MQHLLAQAQQQARAAAEVAERGGNAARLSSRQLSDAQHLQRGGVRAGVGIVLCQRKRCLCSQLRVRLLVCVQQTSCFKQRGISGSGVLGLQSGAQHTAPTASKGLT